MFAYSAIDAAGIKFLLSIFYKISTKENLRKFTNSF